MSVIVGVVSCGTDAAPDTEREALVYAAVIRALVAEVPVDAPEDEAPERVIFVGPLDEESPVSLEVQAATVEEFDNEDTETIRFVDRQPEAVDSEEFAEPVLEDGMLILVGTVPSGGAPAVDVQLYIDRFDITPFVATAQRREGEWSVVSLDPAPRF